MGPGFAERSNRLVFEESLRQVRGMIGMWKKEGGRGRHTSEGTRMLSLHVICAAGFGVPQLWPGESEKKLEGKGIPGFSGDELVGDHEMSMKDALVGLLRDIYWFALPPKPSHLSIFSKSSRRYHIFTYRTRIPTFQNTKTRIAILQRMQNLLQRPPRNQKERTLPRRIRKKHHGPPRSHDSSIHRINSRPTRTRLKS